MSNNACEMAPTNEKYDFSKVIQRDGLLINDKFVRSFLIGGSYQFTTIGCEFNSLSLCSTQLTSSRFLDSELRQSNFSGTTFRNVWFKNVTFEILSMRSTLFENCTFDRCVFSNLQELSETDSNSFQNCIFIETDTLPIKSAAFSDCHFRQLSANPSLPKEARHVPLEPSAPEKERDVPTNTRFNQLEMPKLAP
jgi:uncharacterized protein YjbI with pentapeptide repeats